MRTEAIRAGFLSLKIGLAALALPAADTVGAEPLDLTGVWKSHVIHGPVAQGRLLVRAAGERLAVEIGGHRTTAELAQGRLSFALPDGSRFDGRIGADRAILGHWLQPPSRLDVNVFATPAQLHPRTFGWEGTVVPQPDTTSLYLIVSEASGELAAELINPDRNLGVFQNLTKLVRTDRDVTILGRFRGRGPEQPMLRGRYHPDEDVLALRYPGRGGGYDFRRIGDEDAPGFLARARNESPILSPPPELDDGWKTAFPEDAGIDPGPIVAMIESHILTEPTSPHDLSVHALLIARHGRLAVEEYFHGYHRDLPHDSRSASKSVTSLLAAAAMHAGENLRWDTAVYAAFDKNDLTEYDQRRSAITLQHLVNMNSGLDCDDRNPESAANEDRLWDNADSLDFYEHTLGVDLVNPPGEVAAYCSAGSNLAGGVIAMSLGEPLLSLIDRLIARPLGIARYSVPVPPDGHPYMGGGIRWLPRDLLKFPQLLLDNGTWNGDRVLRERDVRRLLAPAVKIDGGRDYGYLWWTEDYEHEGRSVRAHFMGGNGGQIAMLVPSLDLSIVFNAGNYSDRAMFRIQEELIPHYILPAISD